MSRTSNRILVLVVILAFVGFVIWSSMGAQVVECEVCVTFNGQRNCAMATGETEEVAVRTAQNTACGPLARGMNDAIACDNAVPSGRTCRRR